jgi:hypothetical protein
LNGPLNAGQHLGNQLLMDYGGRLLVRVLSARISGEVPDRYAARPM